MASTRTQASLFLAVLLIPNALTQADTPTISDFAFLTGFWKGAGFGGVSEEMWMPPAVGRMFGIFKQSAGTLTAEVFSFTRSAL